MRSKILETEYKLSEEKREYYRLYKKKYRSEGKDKVKRLYKPNYHRDYQRAARRKVVEHYGGKCACCGEEIKEFLAIDHVKGGGRKHRQEIGGNIATWIIREGYPEGYRVLCHNCNTAKGVYGYCPHRILLEDKI